MTREKKMFNQRISKARVVVENAFGQTCQILRIFYTTINKSPEVVDSIIKTTCLLHNILIDRGQLDRKSYDGLLGNESFVKIHCRDDTL